MGEPAGEWDQRIDELLPYQVSAGVLAATGSPAVKFIRCLPALRNREVTGEVVESPQSLVLDQAANRMPTIKALMVATLGTRP